ncbi:MAG: hypothetical protein AB1553_07085 [Nitrospirota bacterium]
MYRKITASLITVSFIVALFGCASVPEEHKGAATGAGIGAATGAIAGALLGSKGAKTEMAVLGGVLGALAGGAIGHYAVDKQRTAQQTAQAYNYQPSRGTMVRIENSAVTPTTVRRGEQVDIKMTYAILGAGTSQGMEVTETREIRHKGELFGRPEMKVVREDGTYTSSMPITIPPSASDGTYTVVTTVRAGNMSDSRETSFVVR